MYVFRKETNAHTSKRRKKGDKKINSLKIKGAWIYSIIKNLCKIAERQRLLSYHIFQLEEKHYSFNLRNRRNLRMTHIKSSSTCIMLYHLKYSCISIDLFPSFLLLLKLLLFYFFLSADFADYADFIKSIYEDYIFRAIRASVA